MGRNVTDAERKIAEKYGIELDENGYITSGTRCASCGQEVWVCITHNSAHWESDITIITFDYLCKHCGSHWREYDSD
jgi:hypothetical protein